jgi:HEAT repeat protein
MLGPQAVPFFAKSLEYRNGPVDKACLKLWPHLPGSVQKRLSRPLDARVVRRRAASGFLSWNASSPWSHTLHWNETDSSPIPYLIRALKDEDPVIRSMVAGALQGSGVAHPEAGNSIVSALIERLQQDPDASVRRHAAGSLGFQGESAQAAIPALVAALNDTSSEVRFSAAGALKRIDPEAARKAGADAARVPNLVKWLQRPEPSARQAAAEELAKLKNLARPAVPALRAALNDVDLDVRASAAKALNAIDTDTASER